MLGEPYAALAVSRFGRLQVFEHGLVVTRRLGRSATCLWSQVSEFTVDLDLRIEHDSAYGSVLTQSSWTLRLAVRGAKPIRVTLWAPRIRTLASDFVRYGVRQDQPDPVQGEVFTYIDDRIADAQLAEALPAVRAGGSVPFGAFTATPEGLRHPELPLLAWQLFDDAYYWVPYSASAMKSEGGWVFIDARRHGGDDGSPERWAQVRAIEVINLGTLRRLGIRLRG